MSTIPTPGVYRLTRDRRVKNHVIQLIAAVPAAEQPDAVAPKVGFGDWLWISYRQLSPHPTQSIVHWFVLPEHLVPA